jgi:transmembrane sensor
MEEMRLYYLAEKAVSNALTEAERHEWEAWLNASEANRREFAEIKEILGLGSMAMATVDADTDAEWAALRRSIQPEKPVSKPRELDIRLPFWSRSRIWAAAAAVLLLVTVGGYFAFFYHPAPTGQAQHYATAAGERKEIKLTDGTKVTLQGGSILDAPAAYGQQDRQVTLQGEAYFDVAKDKSRPFIVHAGSTQCEALGTEFNVRMFRQSGLVQLSVTEGKVRFSADKGGERVLVAGEVAHYDPKTGQFISETTLALEEAAWKESQLIFKDTPFVQAAEQLENHYGMTLQFPERLNAARLTATFDMKSLREVLDVLEVMYSLKATQTGAMVTLSE